jgi:hypothetical protein
MPLLDQAPFWWACRYISRPLDQQLHCCLPLHGLRARSKLQMYLTVAVAVMPGLGRCRCKLSPRKSTIEFVTQDRYMHQNRQFVMFSPHCW